MNQIFKCLSFILLFSTTASWAQKKVLQAAFATEKISIDGKFTEEIWKSAPVATDFVMFQPDNGKTADASQKTEVRLLYDNEAVYIAATLYDDPKRILKEITQRDNVGTADIFGVFLNGFNDGQQDFQFFVSAAGVQMDRLATEDGQVSPDNFQDFTWDAIWDSETAITALGWTVEMKIPYAALRFSKDDIQTWGLNFFRSIRRDRHFYTWSPVDSKINSTRNQNGVLEGIRNIKPPTRLFFIPYASFYREENLDGSENKFKAGMDIKYGINDSFTLDAILVPDFGQTKFDNVILNLGPYEQQFTENRPFFTEGTDLFNKGSLFYSRRIGGSPNFTPGYDAAKDTIVSQSATVNLLNAIKISGRTKHGLGIGVLNAVTEKTFVTFKDKLTGEKRREIAEPLTNYNVLVLDQRFNQNSSVTLVNTNVTRNGSYYDANVSGFLFNLNTKENSYNLSGDFKYSYINSENPYDGFKTSVNFEKTSGRNRFTVFGKYISGEYDINDLGYATQNNYHNLYLDYSYRIVNSTKVFNTFRFDLKSSIEVQNTTGKTQDLFINAGVGGNSVRNDYYAAFIQANPAETFDFYQPRVAGRYSYVPRNFSSNLVFSSNYNRAFAIDVNPYIRVYDEKKRMNFGYLFSPRYRVNDKILLIYSFNYDKSNNDRGAVYNDGTDIFYAERNTKTIVNELSGKLALNNKMTVNLTARYYWSLSENHRFFTLNENGYLTGSDFTAPLDEDFNVWNFDLSYSWWFAPASQISVLYRNNTQDYRYNVDREIGNNLKNLFDDGLNNIFSVSVRYFIDYNAAKKWARF